MFLSVCHYLCHNMHSVETCNTTHWSYVYKTYKCINGIATSYLFKAETHPVTHNKQYEYHKPSHISELTHY
jgi:hypothetical protein